MPAAALAAPVKPREAVKNPVDLTFSPESNSLAPRRGEGDDQVCCAVSSGYYHHDHKLFIYYRVPLYCKYHPNKIIYGKKATAPFLCDIQKINDDAKVGGRMRGLPHEVCPQRGHLWHCRLFCGIY